MATAGAGHPRVVARYVDGRMTKGTTHDFFPGKPEFHVYEDADESRHAVKITLSELKALFFVKTLEGNPDRAARARAVAEPGQGRKIRVKFKDGEQLDGFTLGYNPAKPGFFLVPADADDNATRVFVVKDAVERVDFG